MSSYYNMAVAGRRRDLNEIEGAFIATFETTSGSGDNQTIELPLVEGYSYDFTVHWGDGTFDHIDNWDSPNRVHVYPPKARKYTVQIVGSMPMWKAAIPTEFGFVQVQRFCSTLVSIKTYGDVGFCEGETDFSYMFFSCWKLISIPLLDTSNGTDFSCMFEHCSRLEVIPLLNTSNGTDFSNMFEYCSRLEVIPLLNTSNGTDFSNMFEYCSRLEVIPLLNTSNGTNFSGMFRNCESLVAVPSLDMTSGILFGSLFNGCENLETVSCNFGSNGECFFDMFGYCKNLTSIPAIDTGKGKMFMLMFYECESLTTIPGIMVLNAAESQEPGYPTPYSNMFYNCSSLESFKLTSIIFNINFEDCPLSDYEVRNDIYSNLAVISGKTITMPSLIAGEDRSIATNKGWTVL